MKIIVKILVRVIATILFYGLMTGCGDNEAADPCYVATDWNVGYQDCGAAGCVAGCGVLPQDGSPGHALPAGCMVNIGTASTSENICVSACSECH